MITLKKLFFHEGLVRLIYKIKYEEELLKDILLLGRSLGFSKPFVFHLHNPEMGKDFSFYDTGKGYCTQRT